MVDIYEVEKCKISGRWKTHEHRLMVIKMPFDHAKTLFKQQGILACENKFKILHRELHGAFPARLRAIGLMHGYLYALSEHHEANHTEHPEPVLFGGSTCHQLQ